MQCRHEPLVGELKGEQNWMDLPSPMTVPILCSYNLYIYRLHNIYIFYILYNYILIHIVGVYIMCIYIYNNILCVCEYVHLILRYYIRQNKLKK